MASRLGLAWVRATFRSSGLAWGRGARCRGKTHLSEGHGQVILASSGQGSHQQLPGEAARGRQLRSGHLLTPLVSAVTSRFKSA